LLEHHDHPSGSLIAQTPTALDADLRIDHPLEPYLEVLADDIVEPDVSLTLRPNHTWICTREAC
jgi:hypothetical protein